MTKKPKKTASASPAIPKELLPRHVAIIMDGNGRWAQKRLLPRNLGHREGMKALKEVVRASSELGIEVLTVYAFSTENWSRPGDEVSFLMNLLVEYIEKELEELHQNGVQVHFIGERDRIPAPCIAAIDRASARTGRNTGMIFNVAVNYGGRQEIVRAVRQIAAEAAGGRLNAEDIDEMEISRRLFTAGLPDPDLLIRTAGEKRVSNYLLWQIAYAEFVVFDKMWPDFTGEDLRAAVGEYLRRERRFGGLK